MSTTENSLYLVHLTPNINADILVPELITFVLSTSTVKKAISDLTTNEFVSVLSDLNRRSILTGVFGKDGHDLQFISDEELQILTVLHGININCFEWKKDGIPIHERKFKTPNVRNLPQHILVAQRINSGELTSMISPDSEAAAYFLSLIDISVQLREQAICRNIFCLIPISCDEAEKKKVNNTNGFAQEVSIEPINRPLEKKYTVDSYEVVKDLLAPHRKREEKDKDGIVTKIIAIFDVDTCSDEDYIRVMNEVFGINLTIDAIGQEELTTLLTICLNYLHNIDSIIRDNEMSMLVTHEDTKRSKIFMIRDETYRVARAFHVIKIALLQNSVTTEIMSIINPAMTSKDVANILTIVKDFYKYYSLALKASDDAFNALLCPTKSKTEAWVKFWYCFPIKNGESPAIE
jgi:hypothetical protein